MIDFDKTSGVFHLQTPNISYIFMLIKNKYLLHLYYGNRINDIAGIEKTAVYDGVNGNVDSQFKDERYQSEAMRQEYSFYGNTDTRKPSFHAQYSDGSRITSMQYQGHKITKGKPKIDGLPSTYTEDVSEADTLEIEMKDDLTGLVLIYRYSVYNEKDAITRSVTAINNGNEDINIKSIMSCNVDFDCTDFDFVHLWGAWARERYIERLPIGRSRIQIESRKGASSHQHSPFFALAKKNADEESGDVYGFSFVYSGNFEAGVEVDTYNITRAYMGINSFDFNWLLKAGEIFNAPEVVMVYSSKGFGEMSRSYHELYKTRLCRGKYRDLERPILINNWEATYFDFDEEKIVDIAKRAQKVGIDLMVLDDGWFGKRNDDATSLGDWFVNKDKIPSGIEGLAKRIKDVGMNFGLWFEPEMISVESELYKKHPDWCIHVKNRGRSEGRNQLILDLSRSDVCDYIIDFMSEYLKSAPISYIKWDMNRNMSEIGSELLPPERQAETAHRYMLGLYRVLETITSKFPDVLFEGCAGGGGRFDAGMLYYFCQYWTSDNTDAASRLYIQHGTSMVMPSSVMGSHVTSVPKEGKVVPLKMRGAVAMCGQFGYEMDITKMNDDELEEIKEQIITYKSIREVIHNGKMYRLKSPFEGNSAVWEYVSQDKKTAVIFRLTTNTDSMNVWKKHVLKLNGLDSEAMYTCRNSADIYSGDVLMNYGISVYNQQSYNAEMIILDKNS